MLVVCMMHTHSLAGRAGLERLCGLNGPMTCVDQKVSVYIYTLPPCALLCNEVGMFVKEAPSHPLIYTQVKGKTTPFVTKWVPNGGPQIV